LFIELVLMRSRGNNEKQNVPIAPDVKKLGLLANEMLALDDY